MKDIPVFTGSHGVATLILSQIPWSGCGYVMVRSVWDDTKAFLDECLGFCCACGAETVYASWDMEDLPAPHGYDMVSLTMEKSKLSQEESIATEDLTEHNSEAFLNIYNTCFQTIPHAAAYGKKDIQRLLGEETAYLVKRGGEYAAIAEISKEVLEAIAVLPRYRGLGYDLARTVLQNVPSKTLKLKTASTNERARALYRRLGFANEQIISRWWKLR